MTSTLITSPTAEWAVNKARELKKFDEVGLARTLNGFYYISHYPPLRAQDDTSAEEASALFSRVDASQGFETYIHFPFCEVICSFCHFFKELGGRDLVHKEDRLVSAVKKEIMIATNVRGGKLQAHSLQLGGGTPSLMSNPALLDLLKFVDTQFDFHPGAEKKIEIFPKHHDLPNLREKLMILRDYGFTDIVVDIESGNQASLHRIGRGITSMDAYLEIVSECVKAGFTSVVSALMMGLPHETLESLEETVNTLLAVPEIKVINTFPAIMRDPDPLIRQYRNNPEWFPDAEMRDAMWLLARKLFEKKGYTEGPISYLHNPAKRPAQQQDKFECVNLMGFGPSSFGYWNGDGWAAQCFNFANFNDYYARVDAGEMPLWRAGVMDNDGRARRKIIFGLANCKTEDLIALEGRFGTCVDRLFGQQLNALLHLDLIRIDREGRGVYYTPEGLARLEEISYFFGSDELNDRTKQPIDAADPRRIQLIKQHYYPAIEPENERRWKGFISGFSSSFMEKVV